jgi:hypothetical protein
MSNVIKFDDTLQFARKILVDEAERRGMVGHVKAKIRQMTRDDMKVLAQKIQYLTGRK